MESMHRAGKGNNDYWLLEADFDTGAGEFFVDI
jgi:hypothetical protein